MNKFIFTNDRLFMALVGPGGSGKTRLIYSMLSSPTTFYPPIEKTFNFYREYQPLFQGMSERLNIEFIPCLDFEKIKNLENCLFVFDISCEEIYQEQAFVKLAVTGRHGKLHCIFVKHNLFHESKWSRTIDLNTTHVILFKSLRDLQQFDNFGRQLKQLDFIREAYQRATTKSFGHLLIDFDPKTNDVLRFCSIIVAPQPTTFYIPSSTAKETLLTIEREKIAYSEALARKQKEERHFSHYTSLRQRTNQISL